MGVLEIQRFAQKVEILPTGCWEWKAGKQKSGYGKLKWNNRTYRAHRWSYEQTYGEIPQGLQLDHLCNKRDCVNPRHLRVVTARENTHADHSMTTARVNAEKQECPRGHLLADWNVNESFLQRGERACKSCNHARSRNRYCGRPAGWWMDESDRLYVEARKLAV